jgi:hypothetical protein
MSCSEAVFARANLPLWKLQSAATCRLDHVLPRQVDGQNPLPLLSYLVLAANDDRRSTQGHTRHSEGKRECRLLL